MKIREILALYRIIGAKTPIKADCGELCGAACCQGGEEDGMMVLPGEEKLLRLWPGMRIKKSANGHVYAVCDGRCRRALRPFSCRIYPLALLKVGDEVRVVADSRAKYRCPLLAAPAYIDPDFVRALRKAGKLICRSASGRAYLEELAKELRAYYRFTGK